MSPADAVYFLALSLVAGTFAGLFARFLRVRG